MNYTPILRSAKIHIGCGEAHQEETSDDISLMIRRDSKKEFERFLLDRFLSQLGVDVQDVIEREAPDFLVKSNGEWVGVELMQIHIGQGSRGSQLKKHSALSDDLVGKAKQKYAGKRGPHLHVNFTISDSAPLSDINRDEVAQDIANFIECRLLSSGNEFAWRPEFSDTQDLPEWIAYLHVVEVPEPGMAHWNVGKVGWAAPVTPELLQPSIDQKANRLERYRTSVAINWLVLAASGRDPSQFFEVPHDLASRSINSPFTKTFFYYDVYRTIVTWE